MRPVAKTRCQTAPAFFVRGLWTDGVSEGSATIDAPPGKPPVFARSGAVLALGEGAALALHLYPPPEGPSESTLFLDAGDGHAEYRVETFALGRKDGAVRLDRRSSGGLACPPDEITLVPHGFEPREAETDGQAATHAPRVRAPGSFRTARFSSKGAFGGFAPATEPARDLRAGLRRLGRSGAPPRGASASRRPSRPAERASRARGRRRGRNPRGSWD